jgi:hypothetical protein
MSFFREGIWNGAIKQGVVLCALLIGIQVLIGSGSFSFLISNKRQPVSSGETERP